MGVKVIIECRFKSVLNNYLFLKTKFILIYLLLKYNAFMETLDFFIAEFQEQVLPRPALKNETCYFYFDEIQRIEGWELFIRRLLDTENVQVTLTGSSAKLPAKEIATSLRGRSLATELFPFSFAEYLRFHGVEPPGGSAVSSRTKAVLENHLQRYFHQGGFPEMLDLQNFPEPRAVIPDATTALASAKAPVAECLCRGSIIDVRHNGFPVHHYVVGGQRMPAKAVVAGASDCGE